MRKTMISLVFIAAIAGCGGEPATDDPEPIGTAQSAQLISCSYSANASIPQLAATCYETSQKNWYLQVTYETPMGKDVVVKGTLQYGPGVGTSIVKWPKSVEVVDSALVEF